MTIDLNELAGDLSEAIEDIPVVVTWREGGNATFNASVSAINDQALLVLGGEHPGARLSVVAKRSSFPDFPKSAPAQWHHLTIDGVEYKIESVTASPISPAIGYACTAIE